MASGFLLAEALAEAVRKPYHQGDLNITTQYLVEGLKVGTHRVMLKRNFDTACWIPPTGSRGSHSIYYGDRMLGQIFARFCKQEGVEMPSQADFKKRVIAKLEAEAAEAAASPKAKRAKAPSVPPLTRIFNERLQWLKDTLTPAQWGTLMTWLVTAVASYGRHEREHARQTPQDMKQVSRDLKVLGIPFKWFNLFEDSRIEHHSREELGAMFEWTLFENLAPANNPWNLYLRCIQLEGEVDREALDDETPFGDGSRVVGDIAERVAEYYERASRCATADHMFPVITEFLEEFKDDIPPPDEDEGEEGSGSGKGKGKKGSGEEGEEGEGEGGEDDGEGEGEDSDTGAGERAGDLSTAAEAADKGDEFFDEFESDTEIVGGTDPEGAAAEDAAKGKLKASSGKLPPPGGKGSKSQGIPESIEPQASGGRARTGDFLADTPGQIDGTYAARVTKLTATLMRMFKTHSLPAALETPANRISGRHLARGELKFVHKRVFGGKGKRKYSIIYDCSGSMGGRPDREGKLLLLALNNLAKRGFLEGTLVLSGWVNSRPGWLSYAFPVKDEVILSINPHHSSEGLQDSLADNLRHIKGMDDVFVYTDACICDAPLDRDFFARHRVWPVGLYVGKEDQATEMERHFPQNIIRDTIEDLVETMLTRNRRSAA